MYKVNREVIRVSRKESVGKHFLGTRRKAGEEGKRSTRQGAKSRVTTMKTGI